MQKNQLIQMENKLNVGTKIEIKKKYSEDFVCFLLSFILFEFDCGLIILTSCTNGYYGIHTKLQQNQKHT